MSNSHCRLTGQRQHPRQLARDALSRMGLMATQSLLARLQGVLHRRSVKVLRCRQEHSRTIQHLPSSHCSRAASRGRCLAALRHEDAPPGKGMRMEATKIHWTRHKRPWFGLWRWRRSELRFKGLATMMLDGGNPSTAMASRSRIDGRTLLDNP